MRRPSTGLTAAVVILAVSLTACGGGGGAGQGESHADDEHHVTGTETPKATVTHWTEDSELFMEYPLLVAGQAGRFAIHVTGMIDFKPATDGAAVVVLRGREGPPLEFRGAIARPGIYLVDVTPARSGVFDMSLRVEAEGLRDIHELGAVTVHEAGSSLPDASEHDDAAISFLKEQQWQLEFGTEPVVARELQASLVVPGEVEARAGGEAELSAPVPGRVDPSVAVPFPGQRVTAGDVLARIVPHSEQLHDPAGLRADLIDAEQEYGLARQERERAARLVSEGVLAQIALTEAEAAVAQSRGALEAARERLQRLDTLSESEGAAGGGDWFVIRAPFDGVIAEVHFAAAASVEEGAEIVHLVDTDTVHVVGHVPESRASLLQRVGQAEILREGVPALRLETTAIKGAVVEPLTRTVEVHYSLDNRELHIPVGLAVRLRLFIGREETRPAVPETAVIDDGGQPVVYLQTGGESFERRPVRLGNREGGYVQVLDGVDEGERVVSRGAYLIRLASMSSNTPVHGHAH